MYIRRIVSHNLMRWLFHLCTWLIARNLGPFMWYEASHELEKREGMEVRTFVQILCTGETYSSRGLEGVVYSLIKGLRVVCSCYILQLCRGFITSILKLLPKCF